MTATAAASAYREDTLAGAYTAVTYADRYIGHP
jgi:hypothetical protein